VLLRQERKECGEPVNNTQPNKLLHSASEPIMEVSNGEDERGVEKERVNIFF
jgi:hypothetical protein